MLQRKLTPRLKDLDRFIIPCSIASNFSCKILFDLGTSIKLNALVYLQEVRTRRSETCNYEVATS